jgi:type II secretory pathway pseudopilin PulG
MQYRLKIVERLNFRRNDRRRRATTLVEVMAVAALMSILFGVVASLAVSLRHWDRQVREHSVRANQLSSLAETIRTDIRRATRVSQIDKKVVAVTGPDKREIRYELQPDGCRRVVKTPGDSSQKVDTFAIGPAEAWKLETATTGRRPAYTITLERSDTNKSSNSAPFYVYAAIGSESM